MQQAMDASVHSISFPVMDPLALDDALHLRLLATEHITIDRNWNTRDVCSPYWRIYVNDSDGAELELAGGKRWRLPCSQVHLIPAWVPFSCRNTGDIGHLYIHAELVGIPGTVVREVFPQPAGVALDPTLRSGANRLMAQLADTQLAAPARLCHAKSFCYEVLGRLFAALPPDRIRRCLELSQTGSPVANALRMIEDRFHEALSNGVLAASCRLSEDHFIRSFRTSVGQTPAQYVLERRVAAAAQRLVFTREPIEMIAAGCGFPDRFYFSRIFRRRMGLPPAAFRARGSV